MGSCKEYNKKYYLKNKEKFLKKSKEYYYSNKEVLDFKHIEYYHNNKEKCLENNRQYYQQTKEEISLKNKKRYLKNLNNSFERRLLNSSKQRAKQKQIEFNLDLSDIVIPDLCPYLGIPLTKDLGRGRVYSNASVDRIDSSKGYVKGNIQIISYKANVMKQDATIEQLVAFAKGILKLHEL